MESDHSSVTRFDASEPEVRHARIRRATETGTRAVVEAIADTAQERPTSLHAFWRSDQRIEARCGSGGVDEHTSPRNTCVGFRKEPVFAPLPDVTRHVVQTVAVGWECLDRRSAEVAVFGSVVVRPVSLEGVALRALFREWLIPPNVYLAL